MLANTAFTGPLRERVVLRDILREMTNSAIIHLYRNIDDQAAFWVAQVSTGDNRPNEGHRSICCR